MTVSVQCIPEGHPLPGNFRRPDGSGYHVVHVSDLTQWLWSERAQEAIHRAYKTYGGNRVVRMTHLREMFEGWGEEMAADGISWILCDHERIWQAQVPGVVPMSMWVL